MTEELLNALKLISKECGKYQYNECSKCPMSDAWGECGVTKEEPSSWSLEKREVWF